MVSHRSPKLESHRPLLNCVIQQSLHIDCTSPINLLGPSQCSHLFRGPKRLSNWWIQLVTSVWRHLISTPHLLIHPFEHTGLCPLQSFLDPFILEMGETDLVGIHFAEVGCQAFFIILKFLNQKGHRWCIQGVLHALKLSWCRGCTLSFGIELIEDPHDTSEIVGGWLVGGSQGWMANFFLM